MTSTRVVRFGDETWRKGTRGLIRPHATDRARISNLRMWDDGTLGPRPLWLAETNLPTSIGSTARLWPTQFATGAQLDTFTSGIAAVDNGEVSYFRYGDTTAYATLVTTMDGIHEGTTLSRIDKTTWLLGRYHIIMRDTTAAFAPVVTNVSTAIATAFSVSFSASAPIRSCVHQGRAYFAAPDLTAGAGTPLRNKGRIYYTDAASYTTFASASQFFDVDGDIAGMVSLGPNLLIWTEAGDWYMLQGRGDPALGTLNALGKNRIPGANRTPQIFDGVAYFLSSDTQALVKVSSSGQFNEIELSYLGVSGFALAYNEVAPAALTISSLSNSITSPAFEGGEHRHFYNGTWADEDWGTSTFGNFQVTVDDVENREVLVFYGFSGSNRWQYTYREITNDAPSTTLTGTFSEYTETESCALDLPRLFDPTQDVRVRKVIVDARTFSSVGTAYPNAAMTMQVEDGHNNTYTMQLGPASRPLSGVAEDPHRPIRIIATPTDVMPFTHFSDVKILNMKGIAIEAVTVELEISAGFSK